MKIDLVYTWVDDTDYNWKEKRNRFIEIDSKFNKDATDVCRFYNNDELKYSLRSVELYAPWINKIYIITDGQTPSWLDLSNEKIKIINHEELISKDKLPIFNSCAIESKIPYIEDLSEYFLYANDDMFFWNKVEKDFFFENDQPIIRYDDFMNENKKYKFMYGATIMSAFQLVKSKFDMNFKPFFPHHNIDSYKKSQFLSCIEAFKEEFELMMNNRFRDFSDVQRMIVYFYILAKNEGKLKKTKFNFFEKYVLGKNPDSILVHVKKSKAKELLNSKAKLACINDYRKTNDKDRAYFKKLLEKRFPNKSSFEI